jgi:hypothetical protein
MVFFSHIERGNCIPHERGIPHKIEIPTEAASIAPERAKIMRNPAAAEASSFQVIISKR